MVVLDDGPDDYYDDVVDCQLNGTIFSLPRQLGKARQPRKAMDVVYSASLN